MTEYAIIDRSKGVILDVVMTQRSLSEMQASYRNNDIRPLEECPEYMLKNYRFWNERP